MSQGLVTRSGNPTTPLLLFTGRGRNGQQCDHAWFIWGRLGPDCGRGRQNKAAVGGLRHNRLGFTRRVCVFSKGCGLPQQIKILNQWQSCGTPPGQIEQGIGKRAWTAAVLICGGSIDADALAGTMLAALNGMKAGVVDFSGCTAAVARLAAGFGRGVAVWAAGYQGEVSSIFSAHSIGCASVDGIGWGSRGGGLASSSHPCRRKNGIARRLAQTTIRGISRNRASARIAA